MDAVHFCVFCTVSVSNSRKFLFHFHECVMCQQWPKAYRDLPTVTGGEVRDLFQSQLTWDLSQQREVRESKSWVVSSSFVAHWIFIFFSIFCLFFVLFFSVLGWTGHLWSWKSAAATVAGPTSPALHPALAASAALQGKQKLWKNSSQWVQLYSSSESVNRMI